MTSYHENPKGYKNFTDNTKALRKELEKDGWAVKVGNNPYKKKVSKVLFYKAKRKKQLKKSIQQMRKYPTVEQMLRRLPQ